MKNSKFCLRNFLLQFDLFPATQFIRYKQESEYKTATGGFVSIVIMVIFAIMFFNLGIQTINRQIIYGSRSNKVQIEPQQLTVKLSKGSSFMLSIGISSLNLSDTSKKYFNITLNQNHAGPLQFNPPNKTTIPLVGCTKQHFSYSPDTLHFYEQFYLSNALCPPLDYQFVVGGRIVSDLYSYFSIYIDYCNQTIDSRCASQSELLSLQKSLGGFTVYAPLISTIINPQDQTYKQVYVQERNYYQFTTTSGLWMNGQISQYEVNTDMSLMPFSSIISQCIITISQLFLVKSMPIFGNRYVEMVFSKSTSSTVFTRSFNKLDNYLSYVGGLIGTMLIFFYIMNAYSQTTFVIDVASQIYRLSDSVSTKTQQFNFFYFILIQLKKIFNKIGVNINCEQTDIFLNAFEQMEKQLNISILLKKVNHFQEIFRAILPKHQIQTLLMIDKKSIKQAEEMRSKCIISKGISISQIMRMKQEKFTDSSGRNILTPQLHQNISNQSLRVKKINKQQESHQRKEQNQGKSQLLQMKKQLKASLAQVIQESYDGDDVSCRIMSKLCNKLQNQVELTHNRQLKQAIQQFAIEKGIDKSGNEKNQKIFDRYIAKP